MKVLIVYAHSQPTSFNAAMLKTAVDTLKAEGHEVKVSDLYDAAARIEAALRQP